MKKLKKLVAITSCPTGIAHTYMAAESLKQAAGGKELEIKVETRGAAGEENKLTKSDIESAEVVIIASEDRVNKEPFKGKPIVEVAVEKAVNSPEELIEKALKKAEGFDSKSVEENRYKMHPSHLEPKKPNRSIYQHLMNGTARIIPFLIVAGLMVTSAVALENLNGSEKLFLPLLELGEGVISKLVLPVLAGYVATSIAGYKGLASGMIGGLVVFNIEAGFLGGVIAGVLAGYITNILDKNIKFSTVFQSVKTVILVPFLSSLIVGLSMIFIVGEPLRIIRLGIENWLIESSGVVEVFGGLVLGSMVAFDMGGPVNKLAYILAIDLLFKGEGTPMAAVMAAGMTPPLSMSVATLLLGQDFNQAEKQAGKEAGLLGLLFITEGAIPFAASDPYRVVPSLMAGSAAAGVFTIIFGCSLYVPHGGILVTIIPGVLENISAYILSILIGIIVTLGVLKILKKEEDKI